MEKEEAIRDSDRRKECHSTMMSFYNDAIKMLFYNDPIIFSPLKKKKKIRVGNVMVLQTFIKDKLSW